MITAWSILLFGAGLLTAPRNLTEGLPVEKETFGRTLGAVGRPAPNLLLP